MVPLTNIAQISAGRDPAEAEVGRVRELAASISALLHTFNRARAHMLDKARHDVEWSAQLAIATLVEYGPMRAGALAEQLQSDPSTVSRQVAALVRDGLVERKADPEDGRASLLVATEQGRAVHAHHRYVRDQHFAAMLSDWSDEDCEQLTTLMCRLTKDFSTYKAGLVEGGWTSPETTREEQF